MNDELMTNAEAQTKEVVSDPFRYSVIRASFVGIRHSMGARHITANHLH